MGYSGRGGPVVGTRLCRAGTNVALPVPMLKLLGSYALAKLLGFGIIGALVIYAILSVLT